VCDESIERLCERGEDERMYIHPWLDLKKVALPLIHSMSLRVCVCVPYEQAPGSFSSRQIDDTQRRERLSHFLLPNT